MNWQITIAVGQSYATALRMAHFALALAEQTSVGITDAQEHSRPAWKRLLGAAQLQRWQNLCQARPSGARALWVCNGTSVPAYPPPETRLALATQAHTVPTPVLQRYAGVWGLHGGPQAAPIAALPLAIDSRGLQPQRTGAPASDILLIASGDGPADLTAAQVWLSAGARIVHLFDPWDLPTLYADLPTGVTHHAAGLPEQRRALYGQCGAVVHASSAPDDDDYFVLEASCFGLVPLAALLPDPARAASFQWDAASCSQALALAPTRGHVAMPAVDWLQAVLPLQAAGDLPQSMDNRLAALLQRVERQTSTRPIVIVQTPNRPSGAASAGMLGFSVATDAIAHGLQTCQSERFALRWLPYHPNDQRRQRVYYYPFGTTVGLESDELDYATLPRWLREKPPQLLCTTNPYASSLIAARSAWAANPPPVVSMLHSIHTTALTSDAVFALLDGPSLPFDAIVSPSQCGVVAYQGLLQAASDYLAQHCKTAPRFAGQFHVIPYGIDTTPLRGQNTLACKLACGIAPERRVILSFGRFLRHGKADVLPLLLAFKQLRARHSDALLVLAGSSERTDYPAHLRALADELQLGASMLLLENSSPADKCLLYGAADVYVSISDNIQETYGLTVLEAMAAGLPVVAAGWDGFNETVHHNESGLLIPTHSVPVSAEAALAMRVAEGSNGYGHRDLHESVAVDPYLLHGALDALLSNRELARTMGAAGQQRCLRDYDQYIQAQRMGDLFAALIDQAKGATWPAGTPPRPYYDPVGERFAHFASAGALTPQTQVELGPWAENLRSIIGRYMGWSAPHEVQLLETLCEWVRTHAGCTIEDLGQGTGLNQSVLMHSGRLLKYGVLRRVDRSS